MINNIATVNAAIEQAIQGEAAPGFSTAEFKGLMDATTCILNSVGSDPFKQAIFESIGRKAVLALLDRNMASMAAERELCILRDNARPVC
jgi:hypothetical protein